MWPDALLNVRALGYHVDELAEVLSRIRVAFLDGHEERLLRPGTGPLALEILQYDARAVRRDESIPVLLPLAAMDMNDLRSDVHVGDFQPAELLVAEARIGKQGQDGFLADVAGSSQHEGDFGLGTRAADYALRFFGPPQLDGVADELSVAFERERGVNHVAVGGTALAHLNDERIENMMRWVQADGGIQPADGADVIVDSAFGQSAAGAEVLRKAIELPFEFCVERDGMLSNHANLQCRRLAAVGQVTFVPASPGSAQAGRLPVAEKNSCREERLR